MITDSVTITFPNLSSGRTPFDNTIDARDTVRSSTLQTIHIRVGGEDRGN